MASLHKRGATWYVIESVGKKRVWHKIGTNEKAARKAWEAMLQAELKKKLAKRK
jgi:hypothetical protein